MSSSAYGYKLESHWQVHLCDFGSFWERHLILLPRKEESHANNSTNHRSALSYYGLKWNCPKRFSLNPRNVLFILAFCALTNSWRTVPMPKTDYLSATPVALMGRIVQFFWFSVNMVWLVSDRTNATVEIPKLVMTHLLILWDTLLRNGFLHGVPRSYQRLFRNCRSLIAQGDKNVIIVQTRFINVVKCVKSLRREFKYC